MSWTEGWSLFRLGLRGSFTYRAPVWREVILGVPD